MLSHLAMPRYAIISVIVLLVILATQTRLHQAKRQHCASFDEPCPVYKHKICGTDGRLYSSRCQLRKAACLKNIAIRPAHPDACVQDEDNDTNEEEEEDTNQSNKLADYSDEEHCEPKKYDSMKQTLLAKFGDVSLLFTQLDENDDGMITLNELWRHSNLYHSPDYDCLLTDLMQHEDGNDDNKLDDSELQQAFNKLYSVTMVTLDENLAVNRIEAHLGDNVEIRCDISGSPQRPAIKWYRHGVNLSSLDSPFIRVFSDGALYLTNLQLSFAGNYTCQAASNPTVKQEHVVHVIVNPIVEVSPRFQWAPIGGIASFECRYETFDDQYDLRWHKNDEPLPKLSKIAILNNGTLLQIAGLEQTDTGAYTCRVQHANGAMAHSTSSLLVQDETVMADSMAEKQQKLWVFHSTGLTIFKGVCGQTMHEMDGRDIIFESNIQLCGNVLDASDRQCDWSQDVLVLGKHLYVGQPKLNRLLVFHIEQLNIVQVIVTDAQPKRLWPVQTSGTNQIWILCDGSTNFYDEKTVRDSSQDDVDFDWRESSASSDTSIDMSKYDYLNDKYLRNRKTIQVVRLSSNESNPDERHRHTADVVHLQPVDGHFDLVYDLFMPDQYESIFKDGATRNMTDLVKQSGYAYAAHWEERSLVKIWIARMEYIHSIRLADCQPISVKIIDRKAGGLVAVLCQTPITHRLNGQLILDQTTDAMLAHNVHINAHESHLSPDQRYLVSILHEHSNNITCVGRDNDNCGRSLNTSTIIVQRITDAGVEFLYDVRTSLDIVNCRFVWKNGKYDLILASGTSNREDLLYLFLEDGHVELLSGVGKPTEGYHRSISLSNKNRVLSVTATESVYTVDISTNKILCQSSKHFEKPQTIIWTD